MRNKTGNIQDRGTSFRIRYVDANGLRQSETYSTLEEAERELAIRLGELASGLPASSKPNTVLFGELADDVVTDYEVNGYASVDDVEARFRLHLIPVFGKRKASQITTAQIRSYILLRQNAGAKTGTINRELEAMRHAFNLAIEGRKLLHMPHVPHLREDNVREGFFTEDEITRLTAHLWKPLDAMVWFGFWTGWRISEIRKLLWSSIDFTHSEIRIWVGRDKNRKGRVFPMTPELHALLDGLSKKGLYVFMRNGRLIGDFRKAWLTACHKAGLPCAYNTKGKPIKAPRTFHDLRRSFAREMDNQGMRRGAIKLLGGWKTDSVFNRYNIVSEADLRTEIERIAINHSRLQKGIAARPRLVRAQKQKTQKEN